MDVSKALASLNQKLYITKLKCHQSEMLLNFSGGYPPNRCQCCKINNTVVSWRKVITSVPQGSVLGQVWFNKFISDIFFFLKDTRRDNYTNDSIFYTAKKVRNCI